MRPLCHKADEPFDWFGVEEVKNEAAIGSYNEFGTFAKLGFLPNLTLVFAQVLHNKRANTFNPQRLRVVWIANRPKSQVIQRRFSVSAVAAVVPLLKNGRLPSHFRCLIM